MPLTIATPITIASEVRASRSLRPSRSLIAMRVIRSTRGRVPVELVHRLEHLGRGGALLVEDDQAVGEVEDAVGDRGRARIVGHHHDRLAVVVARAPEQREDLGARARVEVARRLVGEDDRRPRDERARDRDALLLAARELGRAGGRAGRRGRPS